MASSASCPLHAQVQVEVVQQNICPSVISINKPDVTVAVCPRNDFCRDPVDIEICHITCVIQFSHTMFLDSQIAAKFSCNETEYAYMCRFGLVPFFIYLPHHELQASDDFVLLLGESLNNY